MVNVTVETLKSGTPRSIIYTMAFTSRIGRTFCLLVVWRLLSVFVVQTAHVPDEYWQSLEIAHRMAFGYGYITWEWDTKIRSYIYPFLIAILYKILAFLCIDHATVLITAPRLFQAILSAYADYRFYIWTRNKWALFNLCINWYWYYCATRTLINSVETALTIIALSIFPWRSSDSQSLKFVWIVGFLCFARPTAAVIWIPLCLYHLCANSRSKMNTFMRYIAIGSMILLISISIDTLCYKEFVITPWEFFRANVLHKVADFYGRQHMLWYIMCGIPVILGLHSFTLLIAIWQIIKYGITMHKDVMMLLITCWTIGIYSTQSHKEFRFLLPLLPLFIHLIARGTTHVNYKISEYKRKIIILVLLISNLLPGLYFCFIHQRGSLDLMKILRNELGNVNVTETKILYLMPCHATPLYSHLHVNVSIKFLTCEPNLNSLQNYTDETSIFFEEPMDWLNRNYIDDKDATLPTYIIMFDDLVSKIIPFLNDYKLIAKIYYTHFPQNNYGKYIVLYKKKNQ
ncbi:GPI mannosyltransferase 3 [Orussus abietinus]|uniref:GPI mannosyltransferase 3 n=1 Tax=Orussus abietinus TaxID=222816 RepID=UPI0006268730|nr:GPI mannosyltransferase 3 [Orussus abietinus]